MGQVRERSCGLGSSLGLSGSLAWSVTLEKQSCLPRGQVLCPVTCTELSGRKGTGASLAHVAFPKSTLQVGQGMGSTLSQGDMSLALLSSVHGKSRHLLIIVSSMGTGEGKGAGGLSVVGPPSQMGLQRAWAPYVMY